MMRIGLIAGNGSFPFLVLDAARRQAEQQAKVFLGDLEGEIQASARSTVTQIARAFGYADIRVEFE